MRVIAHSFDRSIENEIFSLHRVDYLTSYNYNPEWVEYSASVPAFGEDVYLEFSVSMDSDDPDVTRANAFGLDEIVFSGCGTADIFSEDTPIPPPTPSPSPSASPSV